MIGMDIQDSDRLAYDMEIGKMKDSGPVNGT